MDDQLRIMLQSELVAFVNAAGARRVIPPVFRLGSPGGSREDQVAIPDEPGFDAGLRADLVEQSLGGFTPDLGPIPYAWVTRGGELAGTDVDAAWCAAAREGYARMGLPFPGFYVITRRGWLDLTQALSREVRTRRRRRTG